ncbi:DUF72 domain-containing protein [Salegentibacter sp. F14]
MKVHIGCSGWNYRGWKGQFYPEQLPQKQWLQYYSGIFNTVEINSTFYRFPRDSTLIKWKETVPDAFKITLKGSRYITHMKKLHDVEQSLEKFYNAAYLLGDKKSCILWQLPPGLHRNDEKLESFCKLLNPDFTNVIEFRHHSWFDHQVYRLLSKYNLVFCAISSPVFPEELIVTGKIAYIRFHGKGKKWYDYDYSREELLSWYKKIIHSDIDEVYAYFNNDLGASAPENARMLRSFFEKEN